MVAMTGSRSQIFSQTAQAVSTAIRRRRPGAGGAQAAGQPRLVAEAVSNQRDGGACPPSSPAAGGRAMPAGQRTFARR